MALVAGLALLRVQSRSVTAEMVVDIVLAGIAAGSDSALAGVRAGRFVEVTGLVDTLAIAIVDVAALIRAAKTAAEEQLVLDRCSRRILTIRRWGCSEEVGKGGRLSPLATGGIFASQGEAAAQVALEKADEIRHNTKSDVFGLVEHVSQRVGDGDMYRTAEGLEIRTMMGADEHWRSIA